MKTTIPVTRRGVVTLPLALRRALGIMGDDVLIERLTRPMALSQRLPG
jgi:bifunctional DNA-binding transcriptional regulator/antitoxin component of YhaV-PrlF toxin-antitoxin module